MTINRSTAKADIFKEFYDLINGNVTDPNSRGTQWIFSSWPDKDIDDRTDYPLIIVDKVRIPEEPLTLTKSFYGFSIDIDIFHRRAKECDELTDEVREAIMVGKVSLADTGAQDIKLDSTDDDSFFRGDIKVHNSTLTFKGRFYFTRVTAY